MLVRTNSCGRAERAMAGTFFFRADDDITDADGGRAGVRHRRARARGSRRCARSHVTRPRVRRRGVRRGRAPCAGPGSRSPTPAIHAEWRYKGVEGCHMSVVFMFCVVLCNTVWRRNQNAVTRYRSATHKKKPRAVRSSRLTTRRRSSRGPQHSRFVLRAPVRVSPPAGPATCSINYATGQRNHGGRERARRSCAPAADGDAVSHPTRRASTRAPSRKTVPAREFHRNVIVSCCAVRAVPRARRRRVVEINRLAVHELQLARG